MAIIIGKDHVFHFSNDTIRYYVFHYIYYFILSYFALEFIYFDFVRKEKNIPKTNTGTKMKLLCLNFTNHTFLFCYNYITFPLYYFLLYFFNVYTSR